MSGTPPLPSKPTHESGGRARDPYQTTPDQDIYRGYAATHGDFRDPHGHSQPIRRYGQAAEGPRPGFARTDESIALSRPYPVQHGEAMVPQHSYLPLPAPLPVQPNYPVASQPPAPENPTFSSPKSQRKTKGHVASACVPCKRAHLRCDAQRPCSRCLSNGKEDACVDVQHKKRGRPRLREDRDLRYDIPGRLGYPQETSARRPLSLYASNPVAPTFEDSLRRTQSYRVLKSQPADPVVPRFIERGSASDANIIPAPLTISTRIPEPAAFLTMDFQIAKLSETFADAVGIQNARGLRLVDLVAPSDRDRLHGHQRQMQQEQARRDPHYLPPIFGRQEEDRVIQSLGFSPEEISKYSLDKHEFVTFISQDGQPRNFAMRLGLAKQESVYFVVVHLNTGVRSLGHPTPSPNPRDVRESHFAYQQPYQQPFSQPTPVSATFEPRRQRLGDTAYVGSRQTGPPGQGAPGQSPGLPSSYAASPSRPDYPAGSSPYQIPRSELGTSHMGVQSSGYRLPPILAPQQASQTPNEPPTWPHQRDDKSRVDIGGLIERPNPPGRQH